MFTSDEQYTYLIRKTSNIKESRLYEVSRGRAPALLSVGRWFGEMKNPLTPQVSDLSGEVKGIKMREWGLVLGERDNFLAGKNHRRLLCWSLIGSDGKWQQYFTGAQGGHHKSGFLWTRRSKYNNDYGRPPFSQCLIVSPIVMWWNMLAWMFMCIACVCVCAQACMPVIVFSWKSLYKALSHKMLYEILLTIGCVRPQKPVNNIRLSEQVQGPSVKNRTQNHTNKN